MKKIISLLLVLSMCLGCLAACGSDSSSDSIDSSVKEEAASEGSKLIGVCMQNMSSSISVLEEEALKATFEPLGYEVQVASADDSASSQKAQLQNFILLGAEMIVVLPCEIEALEDTLLEAREAGIKVVISGGTGSISENAYDAVSSDDEYMIGMYVASVAKTWVEEHMDPAGDWEVAFLSSTISEDAKLRCQGEAQILEPYLKNADGAYVTLMGEEVDEANRIANPVYCEMIASRVSSYSDVNTEMDISGDNRTVVASVLTENPNVRVLIAYNSLASTAGSQYIMDTYSEEEQEQFAFFSGGVMGDEYEYLLGSVSDSGTRSVFRGACQFGGGDAAATLASLCTNVMFGQAGVDYGKSNPNSIGLYFPVDAYLNDGVSALVCYNTPSYIQNNTYAEILAMDGLMTYWDSVNGYNKDMHDAASDPVEAVSGGKLEGGTAYTSIQSGIGGDETHEIDLMDDGTCKFFLPGNSMITDVYAGTYTVAEDGVTVSIQGLTNVDTSSAYTIPGLWGYIDAATGDTVIRIDPAAFTYTVPGGEETQAPEPVEQSAPSEGAVSYTYEFQGMAGTETAQFDLMDDGTCKFFLPGNPMITDVYAGSYTAEGSAVTIEGLTNVDSSSAFTTPGLWDWIVDGGCTITIDEAAGTFVPAQ
ncbi:MAG: sugar ABC transporter substrate-binding protein [Faecousia sp.]